MRWFILLALCFVGCAKAGIENTQVGNFEVVKLFTHDGVTMYRFWDNNTYVYYGVTDSGVTTQYTTNGKSKRRVEAEVK